MSRPDLEDTTRGLRRRRWTIAAALVLLNASVSFRNIWPTPGIWWTGDLSGELVALIALLLIGWRATRPPSRTLKWLTAVWLLLIVGRYLEVTAPALLGREIDLFWDVRFVRDVAAMFAVAASAPVLALGGAVGVALILMVSIAVRWALGRVIAAASDPTERWVLGWSTVGAAVLLLPQLGDSRPTWLPRFAKPVVATYARQAQLVAEALTAPVATPESHDALRSDLSLVDQSDVLLVFLESYGVVTWERADLVARLTESRAQLTAAVHRAGHDLVSASVASPTFGGSSWFAHISLLSGIEVRDPKANRRLMAERRETLVTTFARRGYRTVAIMPGLWQAWPEGGFYGFQDIYGGERLAYKGPQFGWWAIPDQFALAQLGALELDRLSRPPLFVFFPTISTHTPFAPTPLYQPDWQRILTATPFEEADVIRRFDDQPDWTNLSPSYADALAYTHTVLSGFFGQPRTRDLVTVVVGDHQPPALVTGEGASWNVPVHVITSRAAVLDRLRAQGFVSGLEPRGEPLGRMHELLPILLGSFGNPLPPDSVSARR